MNCLYCSFPPEAHDRYDYCPWVKGFKDPNTRYEETWLRGPLEYAISFERAGYTEFPVLTLTGKLTQIYEDYAAYLVRHPELSPTTFIECIRRVIS